MDPELKQNVLHVACYAGHYEIVQYFLEKEEKPDVNARDKFEWTRKKNTNFYFFKRGRERI